MIRRSTASLVSALVLLILVATTAGASVETHVARATIAPGETVELLLRVRGADASQEPAWSELGSDFDIVDARRSERTSIVNGQRDHSVDWQLALAPRRAGELEVPGIAVGASRSEPIRIVVLDATPLGRAESAGGMGRATPRPGEPAAAVTLTLEADDTTPYVQGRVLLTARIVAGPELLEGHLSDPQVEGAVLERVGEDTSYQTLVDGQPGIAIERRYAVFPQRSGTLSIPPLVFEGRVRDTTREPSRARRSRVGGRSPLEDLFARDPFADPFFSGGGGVGGGFFEGFFGPRARSVRAHSAGLTLDVQPKPAGASDQWWLPARSLEILERWEGEPPVFRVGEPVSRILTIRATGLSGAQLPELSLPPIDGAKQYSEPSLDETTTTQHEVVAIRAQRSSLIPTVEGPLTLPAVEIEWWDTAADEPRTARLEARVVQVLPGDDPIAAVAPAQLSSVGGIGPSDPTQQAGDASPPLLPGPPWAQVGGGVAIAGIVLAMALVVVRRRREPGSRLVGATQSALGPPAPPGRSSAERALRRACQGSDPLAASAALRDLARSRWAETPPQTAAAWGRNLDSPALRDAIADLDRVRYSRDPSEWCGDRLWQAYRRAGSGTSAWIPQRRSRPSADRAGTDSNGALPSLYPSR
jgi:hypothetical protein